MSFPVNCGNIGHAQSPCGKIRSKLYDQLFLEQGGGTSILPTIENIENIIEILQDAIIIINNKHYFYNSKFQENLQKIWGQLYKANIRGTGKCKGGGASNFLIYTSKKFMLQEIKSQLGNIKRSLHYLSGYIRGKFLLLALGSLIIWGMH